MKSLLVYFLSILVGLTSALAVATVTAAPSIPSHEPSYDFGHPGLTHDTGHFTQLVWKNTTHVGCGRALCGTKGWYLVCEYWPRGNVIGQFGYEVDKQVNAAMYLVPASVWTLTAALWADVFAAVMM